MIQMQTILSVADNSGAKTVMCIKVLGGSHHMHASLCDTIVVAVKSASPLGKVKAGQVYKAVIVRSKYGLTRSDGTKLQFDTNEVVMLNSQLEMIGTRVFGPVPRELRSKNFDKILSLSGEVV